MQLIFLGTAACYPTVQRAVSCTALRFEDGNVWLFDCGEGSQLQLQKSIVHPGKICKIFITHLHGDHLFGLPGLMCTLGNQKERKEFVLDIYGPRGIRRYLRETLNLSRSTLPFQFVVHELVPDVEQIAKDLHDWPIKEFGSEYLHPQEILGNDIVQNDGVWEVFQGDKLSVSAGPLVHRIPCFGYVIKEQPSPGTLNTKILLEKGVMHGPIYGMLKAGKSIILDTGETINPEDVLGPPKKGRIVTILGDTSDSSGLRCIAQNSDVLVHEATMENKLKDKAIETGHSTPSMAVAFAEEIKAKKLILFHFSQRYAQTTSTDDINILYSEAKSGAETSGMNCEIMLANDLLQVNVERPT